MKVLITGAGGQLGTDLTQVLNEHEVIPLTHADIEITDMDSVKRCCLEYKPDVIINTASYVRVDDCEDHRDLAFQVNALGARNVAVVAQELGARLVHISTDYVFGGIPPQLNVLPSLHPGPDPASREEAESSLPFSAFSSLRGPEALPKQSKITVRQPGEALPSLPPGPDPASRGEAESSLPLVNGEATHSLPLKKSLPLDLTRPGGELERDFPGSPAVPVTASSSDTRSNLKSQGYTEFDPPSPLNVYGRSKLAGEEYVQHLCTRYFIVRVSGLFGLAGSSGKGGNFVETMLRLGRERPELRVVDDQVFSPTYTRDLAVKIAQLINTDYYGIYHITNQGLCSWYEFAVEIVRLAGLKPRVTPITSDQYPQKARRPPYSVLDHYHLRLLGLDDLRSWQEALRDYMTRRRTL